MVLPKKKRTVLILITVILLVIVFRLGIPFVFWFTIPPNLRRSFWNSVSEGYLPKESGKLILDNGRSASIYLPSAKHTQPLPVVVLLHGYGAEATQQAWILNFFEELEKTPFILVLPEGTTEPGGSRFWNAPICCNELNIEVDDVGRGMPGNDIGDRADRTRPQPEGRRAREYRSVLHFDVKGAHRLGVAKALFARGQHVPRV